MGSLVVTRLGAGPGGYLPLLPLAHPAIGADLGGRRWTALGALPDRDRLGSPDRVLAATEEARQETVLQAWLRFFEQVQGILVLERLGADRHRALLEDVLDALDDRVGGAVALGQLEERLDLAG